MYINIVWLRNELRLHDNVLIQKAAMDKRPILILYIFDDVVISKLQVNDSRVSFIYDNLHAIDEKLQGNGRPLLVKRGEVIDIWKRILMQYQVNAVYAAEDYEPDGIKRDSAVACLCASYEVEFICLKDRVIFAKDEVLKKDQRPYLVFTPYKRQWLSKYEEMRPLGENETEPVYYQGNFVFPSLTSLGFERGPFEVKDFDLKGVADYASHRDYPSKSSGTHLGPHLRYGTVSVREVVGNTKDKSDVFLSELIWREFFMQVLYHYPHTVGAAFKSKYDFISWRNDEHDFELWCQGKTGYPLVDAGMRQLNQSGYMHNRVRMVVASFLCKHLLLDWRWGEAYFSSKLLDYEMASNVGNWQWAAGTGCDAAPYFRVFNPITQQKKFDPDFVYIKQWISEYGSDAYPKPMVDHAMARERALVRYREGLKNK